MSDQHETESRAAREREFANAKARRLFEVLELKGFKHFSAMQPVDGLKHYPLHLFEDLNVVILEDDDTIGLSIYGNTRLLLQPWAATLRTVSLQSPNALAGLVAAKPHLVIGPRYHAQAEELVHQAAQSLKQDIGMMAFTDPLASIPEVVHGIPANPNLSVGLSDFGMKVVGDAIDAHDSQKRTPYRPAVEAFMAADALLAQELGLVPKNERDQYRYRKNMVVVRIDRAGTIIHSPEPHELVVSDTKPTGKNVIWIPTDTYLVANDPHPDDLPINYGIVIRVLLQRGVWIKNVIHGTGKNGITAAFIEPEVRRHLELGLYPDAEKAAAGLRSSLRTEEAQRSGDVMAKETRGKVHVVNLRLDELVAGKSDDEKSALQSAIESKIFEVYEASIHSFQDKHPGEVWPVIIDHPFDIHYWHRDTARWDIAVLKQLAIRYETEIIVMAYPGTWAGDEDVYFQTTQNGATENVASGTAKAALHEALALRKMGFAFVLWEICSKYPFGDPNFGLQAPDNVEEWGGKFAERFKGSVVRYKPTGEAATFVTETDSPLTQPSKDVKPGSPSLMSILQAFKLRLATVAIVMIGSFMSAWSGPRAIVANQRLGVAA